MGTKFIAKFGDAAGFDRETERIAVSLSPYDFLLFC